MYNKSGIYIIQSQVNGKRYVGSAEAAKSISENIRAISNIAHCARRKIKSAYGFIWSYTKINQIPD